MPGKCLTRYLDISSQPTTTNPFIAHIERRREVVAAGVPVDDGQEDADQPQHQAHVVQMRCGQGIGFLNFDFDNALGKFLMQNLH